MMMQTETFNAWWTEERKARYAQVDFWANEDDEIFRHKTLRGFLIGDRIEHAKEYPDEMIEVVGFRRNRITQEDCTRFAEMLLESLTEMVGEDEDVGSIDDAPEDIDDGKEGIEMMAAVLHGDRAGASHAGRGKGDRRRRASMSYPIHLNGWGDLAEMVCDEVSRARDKFPGDKLMTLALCEEHGELVQAILNRYHATPKDRSAHRARIKKELVQTMAMCVRLWLDGDSTVEMTPLCYDEEAGGVYNG